MSRYAYSFDEERFNGDFSTPEEAAAEAFAECEDASVVWVGEAVPPPPAESFWSAEDWLEKVSIQDAYSHEWGEDWDISTKGIRQELEDEVRVVLAAWLDRHKLRPAFFNIENPKRIERGGA